METCRKCGANCDNGELRGGICQDCIREEEQRENMMTAVAKMLNHTPVQLRMEV